MQTLSLNVEKVIERINKVSDGGIFLPYIQRDFVWAEEKVFSLLDSLMRHYPIGTILMWETKKAVNHRPFVVHYNEAYDFDESIQDGIEGTLRHYVLDGQQRLQSLYIARCGTYKGGILFFDLNSDPENGRYSFKFQAKGYEEFGWLNVPEFLARNFKDITSSADLKKSGFIPECKDEAMYDRMKGNAIRLYETLKTDNNIIIQDLAVTDNIDIDDIAEVFVRINSEGVVLEKGELIVALLRGGWRNAGREIGQLTSTINEMGYEKPKDFILQCCIAMLSGKIPGSGKTNGLAQLFSAPQVQDNLQGNFTKITEAITDVVSFIAGFSFLPADKIPSYNPILVLACYRYAHGKEAWNGIADEAKAFLFATFLSRALSGQSQKLMEKLLAHVVNTPAFDLAMIEKICKDSGKEISVDINKLLDMKMSDPRALLVMHLVYQGEKRYDPNTMTAKDHIFPKSKLEIYKVSGKGRRVYADEKIWNSIVNCEMLTPMDNVKKGDKLPKDYFTELKEQKVLDSFLKLHRIPSPQPGPYDIWDMFFFREFLAERRKILEVCIRQNLQGLVMSGTKKKTI